MVATDACPVPARIDGARVQRGDIVRAFGSALRETSALTSAQHEVLRALSRCRTAALGGHLAVCDTCGHATPVYNSCRNRHCPTRYFHVAFTLPEALRAIVRYDREALLAMLFREASQTLLALTHCPPSRWCCTP